MDQNLYNVILAYKVNQDFYFLQRRVYTLLNEVDVVVIDVTFKTSPQYFYQLLTIKDYVFGKFRPLFFILMKQTTEESCSKTFNWIKVTNITCPKTIIPDYEIPLVDSSKHLNHFTTTYGCLYHFSQNMEKNSKNWFG